MHGCFATITARGVTLKSAASQISAVLNKRMSEHGIGTIADGLYRTQCHIDEIWELTSGVDDEIQESGFSFFRISPLEKFTMIARFWWIRLSRPHMLVDL